jgi:hypothetical protein
MFTRAVIVLLLVVFASAVAPARSTTTFIGISTHVGNDNVNLREVNASGQRFYLNKATTTFCPKGMPKVGCSQSRFPLKLFCPLLFLIFMFSDGNATVFASNGSGTLFLYAAVPGGQQVYVASGGALGYTVAHSGNVPQDSQRATFNYTPQENMNGVGTLTFDKQDFAACLTGNEGEYQVYAWIPKVNGNLRTNCTSIRIRTVRYTEAAAWSYA